ncbi:MAG: MurR/RpiR family transcriptional regulator [Planctomycetota bacterium]
MSIQELIAEAGERLTPTDRRVAEAVLEDPTLLAFGTVSDLATRVDTSRPSIVRFAMRLGFEGYADLQSWARDRVTEQLSIPSQRIRRGERGASPSRSAIEGAFAHALACLDAETLGRLAVPIASARRVWIVSGETSLAGAYALHSGLSMARADVRLVRDQSTGRDLASAGDGDAAVVIDFERYRSHAVNAARLLADAGVTIVAITDSPLSPLVPIASCWCELRVPAVGPFDSALPAVLAAELIVERVVELSPERTRERLDRLETLWRKTGTFVG